MNGVGGWVGVSEKKMSDVLNAIVNNGVAIGMLMYFIYKDSKWTETINKSLTSISDSLEVIKETVVKKK